MTNTLRSVAMVALIARSKLVPDFALTIHVLHLVITTLYTGSLPRHTMWWATMLSSASLAVGVGIWGCRYRELQPVFFGGGRILGSRAPNNSNGSGNGNSHPSGSDERAYSNGDPAEGDEEMGFARGGRRGRGRDGAGEYEMVKMDPAR